MSRGIRMPLASAAAGAAALRAYTELDDGSVLAWASAARLWNAPLPFSQGEDWRIHLARPPRLQHAAAGERRGHLLTLLPGEVVELDGVRLTSPARTWLDLCRRC